MTARKIEIPSSLSIALPQSVTVAGATNGDLITLEFSNVAGTDRAQALLGMFPHVLNVNSSTSNQTLSLAVRTEDFTRQFGVYYPLGAPKVNCD